MNDPLETLILRSGEPSDWNRVRSDWKLSYATSAFAEQLTHPTTWRSGRAGHVYWGWQEAIVERLLRRAKLTVACWAEDIRSIVGWAITEEPNVLHYVFVARGPKVDLSLEPYRRLGIARRLITSVGERADVIYTHRSRICQRLPIPSTWTFDPRPACDGLYALKEAA